MATDLKCFASLSGVDSLDERGEKQDHIAAFVHNGGATVGTGHFAGELVPCGAFGRVIPAEIVVAVGEVDVW